ncbi:Six-hairpin glycosidase-like protein [Naematelia encephala]|uniref:Six-hairpin glycosidase-like protein n=1 Tax=Naematelia encephala TaxID=71784 RepID=A0A1Y2BKJ9_9TREE|nr:Six-hairpin glycosidase-like protein [Naematelia encephala]
MSIPPSLASLPPVLSYPSCEFLGPVLPVAIHENRGDITTQGIPGHTDFTITLCKEGDEETLVVLDYGRVVSGVPKFQVEAVEQASGNAAIELLVAYSEGLQAVYLDDGDGPFPYTAGANTIRAVPYNLTAIGPVEDFFMQGGQRWQAIKLKSPGKVTLSGVGFRPTAFHTDVSNLPGYFRCSDGFLNDIWECGSWSGQINQIPARINTPSFQPTILGTIVDSQRPSQYYHGSTFDDYRLSCTAKILSGGLIFSIRNSTGFGLQVQFLASALGVGSAPVASSMRSNDLSIGPNDSVVKVFWGMYDQPQITLYPILLGQKKLENKLELDRWYRFDLSVQGGEDIIVKIDGIQVAELPQGKGIGKQEDGLDRQIDTPRGSFGFGVGKHHVAIFKNLIARSVPSEEIIYSNSLCNNSVLTDFCVSTNPVAVVYDGAKRDRAVWLGDTVTQSLALYHTTHSLEYMEGSIDTVLLRQNSKGFFPHKTLPGLPMFDIESDKEPAYLYENYAGSFSLYIVRVVWEYWWHTGDLVCLRKWYPCVKKVLAAISNFVDDRGLLVLSGPMGVDSDYYNTPRTGASIKQNSLYVIALDRASQMARSLSLYEDSEAYLKSKHPLVEACNTHLWNSQTGSFDSAESMRGELSEDGNAFAILSGICPPDKASQVIKTLRQLYTPNGVLSFPLRSRAMAKPVVSPIMNSWHMQACLELDGAENDFGKDARKILEMCWSPMVDKKSPWYSGAFWEFSTPDGVPFMDKFCSLAHPFSAQPVQQIVAYVLGARPTSPGWGTFIISPLLNFCAKIEWAQGRVPTPHGAILVAWRRSEQSVFEVDITVPVGIQGVFELKSEGGALVTLSGGATSIVLLAGRTYSIQAVL